MKANTLISNSVQGSCTFLKTCAQPLASGTSSFKHILMLAISSQQLLQWKRLQSFFPRDYNHDIRQSILSFNFGPDNTLIAHEATVKGTKYKKNMIVVLNENSEGFVMGKIIVVLVHNSSAV